MSSLNRHNQRRKGVTAVEFSIVAPILFLLVFAAIEFSRMNILRHTADNAAYEAARLALVPGGTSDEAIDFARSLLDIQGVRGGVITVTPDPLLESTEMLTVDVSIPMDGNAWFSRFSKNKFVNSSCSLMTERVPVIQANTLTLPPADGGSDGGGDGGGDGDDGGSTPPPIDDGSGDDGGGTPTGGGDGGGGSSPPLI